MDLSFMASGKILEKPGDGPSNKFLRECVAQLDEYFDRRRTSFDIPLDLNGTPFQRAVWRALLLIPYGSTWSYGKLASQIGRPNASRAVGGANHRNPVSIIVPCHRVIGGDGSLTGYGGGLWRKEWLLLHEANFKADVESE
jgi:methylated-DNA-[protein]-cysteine S-methyltransferase